MSVQRFLKLEEALELLNSLDSNEIDIEITVLPPALEPANEERGDENEVNSGEIIVKDVPGSLEEPVKGSILPESTEFRNLLLEPGSKR
ncbi:hypothetical protein TNCV_1398131 [Trichonephila clavipes]|nr:hypothetical protein TNCV_1398131 [Trichonephila clavipes]